MTTKWDRYEKDLVDIAYEEAHQAWLEEKATILDFWVEQLDVDVSDEGKNWIRRTIKFIESSKGLV